MLTRLVSKDQVTCFSLGEAVTSTVAKCLAGVGWWGGHQEGVQRSPICDAYSVALCGDSEGLVMLCETVH